MSAIFDIEQQNRLLKKYHVNTKKKVNGGVIVTGRTDILYYKQLFPDYSNTDSLLDKLYNSRVLDLGCGLNYRYEKALLYKLIQAHEQDKGRARGKAEGLDKHHSTIKHPHNKYYIEGDIYNIPLPDMTYDFIMSSNLLYLWIDTPDLVKKALAEIYRILKVDGEFRVFPVNFANYHLNNKDLFKWINNHFCLTIIKPQYYAENPIYIKDNKISTHKDKAYEVFINKKLRAHTVIFKKK